MQRTIKKVVSEFQLNTQISRHMFLQLIDYRQTDKLATSSYLNALWISVPSDSGMIYAFGLK